MNRRQIKVLLIDDDEEDCFLTRELFKEIPEFRAQVDWAPDLETGLKSIRDKAHEIYFVDYLLGAETGIDFLRNARELGNSQPIILLTGKGDHDIDKKAMELGASDYLVKSELDAEKLERSLRYAVDRYEVRVQLEKSEFKYRNIFERTRDMIFIADSQGMLVDSNDSVTRVLEYTRSEIFGKHFHDLIVDPAVRNFFMDQVKLRKDVHDFEQALISKSGKKKICLISLTFLDTEEGNPSVLGVIHDITKRRKAEQDLIISEKLAVTGRIVRMIAHEIRNPLTNITLSLEQMEAEMPVNRELKVYSDIIKRNTDRISSLLIELLNSSKPAQLTIGKFSISKLIDETLTLINDRLLLRNVKVETHYHETNCKISVDSGKMKLALLNIFINAIEAMDDSNGVLTITTYEEESTCVIEIEDNGKGIPQDDIGRIFDPFFSGKPKGSGLGLSTTQNIIRTHDGTVEVTSELGKGTKFVVRLKLE